MAHPGGRPLLFDSPDKLQALVDNYFDNNDKITLSGLALHLNIDRKTLYNYEDKDEFFHIIKKARERVESVYEERLVFSSFPTGVIFALKNMGWKDKQETDLNVAGTLQITGMEIR